MIEAVDLSGRLGTLAPLLRKLAIITAKKKKNIDRRFSRQYSMMAATNNLQLCCIWSAFPNGFGCTFNIGHILHHGIANTTLYVKGLKLNQ